MLETKEIPTVAQVFAFWRPLASTLLMMAVEAPIIVSVLAREADSAASLAAYTVSLGLCVLCESPVLRILSAAITLVTSAASFARFRIFALANSVLMSLILLLLTFDPLFDGLARIVFKLTPEVAEHVHVGLAIFSISPFLVGYRRLYQGILIRAGRPRAVAFCTLVRVVVFATSAIELLPLISVHGIVLASLSHVLALVAEAFVSRVLVAPQLRALSSEPGDGQGSVISYRSIAAFYYPLSLSSILGQLVAPVQATLVARGHLPLQSLAVLPGVQGFCNLFSWSAFAIQDTALALVGRAQSALPAVVRCAVLLGAGLSALYALITATVLGTWWFGSVNGLTNELLPLAHDAALILIPIPALVVWRSLQRALLLTQKRTAVMFVADVCDIFTTLGCSAALILWAELTAVNGVVLGGVLGTLINAIVLRAAMRRV